jgi:RNA polymerase sigma-70 factor (sigma-E family)
MDVAVVDESDTAVGFDEWVESRSTALTRFAYLVTGTREEAEDALQSALTSACAKWSRVRRSRDPEAYVRRMIVNAHVSMWRSFRRRESPVEEVRDPGVMVDPSVLVDAADLAWRLCATLPPRQRAAVVLRFYEDLGYPEIAGVLGISEATARAHIHRALKALRESIETEPDDAR